MWTRNGSWLSSEKENFHELTMKLYLGIGHNRTTKKKGNPKSTQELGSSRFFHSFLNVVAMNQGVVAFLIDGTV